MEVVGECFLCQQPATQICQHCDQVLFCTERCRQVHRPADQCFFFAIKSAPAVGRYMVATRDIAALDTILVERAAALGPKLRNKAVCLECSADLDLDDYVPCKKCGLPFCSDTCRKARVLHETECDYVARCEGGVQREDLEEDTGVLAAITALRLLRQKNDNPDVFERADMLVDNIDTIKNTEDWTIQEKAVKFLRERCGIEEFTAEEIHRALGIFKSNSCNIAGFRARALFPTFSLINHSCVRNARHIVSSKEGIMEIVAQRDIRAGDEINVRYTTSVLETNISRRRNIQSQWHFDCACIRCSDNTECGSFTSAIICQKCKVGKVIPEAPLKEESSWICDKCGEVFTSDQVENIVLKIKKSIEKIPEKDVEKLEKFLRIAENILHPNHCLLVNVKKNLFGLYGTAPGLQLQQLSPVQIGRKIQLAEQHVEVMEKIDPGLTAWKGQIFYEVNRFKIVINMQNLQGQKISIDQFVSTLEESVSELEQAVAGISGEKYSVTTPSLRQRVTMLAKVQLLGEGYKMLLNTCLKMPFVK